MSQHDQVPCFCTRTLPPDVSLLNRLQKLPSVDYSFLSRFKFEDSNLGDIVDEIEEEEEEEIMEEDEEEVEETVNESILDEEIIEEEEDVEVENMETTMESGFVQTRMEYNINPLNQGYQQQQGLNQTSGRRRTARMRVNTNYIHFRIQEPQPILDDTYSDEIEDEDEDDIIEIVDQDMSEYLEDDEEEEVVEDQDMSEYFETSTYYVAPVMDIDVNQVAGDEQQEACAICLLEYKDEDTIATLQCGHEFHAECINKWLQRKDTCPFCRAAVYPTTHE